MFRQLLVGGVVSLGNIAVHAIVMTLVVNVVRRVGSWERRNASLWLASVMIATVGVLLVAHVAEVILWSVTYLIVDAAPSGADVLYFAFVNTRRSAMATSFPSSAGASSARSPR
jgi:hypothetical protein